MKRNLPLPTHYSSPIDSAGSITMLTMSFQTFLYGCMCVCQCVYMCVCVLTKTHFTLHTLI